MAAAATGVTELSKLLSWNYIGNVLTLSFAPSASSPAADPEIEITHRTDPFSFCNRGDIRATSQDLPYFDLFSRYIFQLRVDYD